MTQRNGTALKSKDEKRELCLRTDRESRPLPCCKEKGHDGPCYFRW